MSLKVTNVKIIPSKRTDSKLKAFVDITFDDILTCRGWKVIDGSRGLFVAAPSQKSGEQYYDNILFVGGNKKGSPGDRMRQYVQQEVLKKFGELRAEAASIDQTQGDDPYTDDVPF